MGSHLTADHKNGEYSIANLHSGKYYVRSASYQQYENEYYDNVYDWQDATLVDVLDGQETSGIDFSLVNSYDQEQGAISGHVFDTDGNPIENCFIYLISDNYRYGGSGITDINGMYIVGELQTGSYKISAEYNGDDKNFASEWYENAENLNDATSISVVEPDTTKNIDFVLDYGGAIMGTVIEPNGSAVYTHEAEVTVYDNKENYINNESPDEKGEFIVSKLSTGTYKLRVHYNGMKNYIEGNYNLDNWYYGTNDFNNATLIDVTVSDTTKNIIINLHEGGRISGKVYNYNGALIESDCKITAYLNDQDEDIGYAGVENGIYSINKLPTGSYKLYAEYKGYTQYIGQEPLSEWYDGADEFDNADLVEVFAPNTTGDIDYSLEKGGYISGRVVGTDGLPLSYSGRVYAYNLNYEIIGSSEFLNEGMYFITGLPTGEYKLYVYYYGDEDYVNEWYNDKSSFETATNVTVNAPSQTVNINFTLDHPGIIQGFITDINGVHLTEENHNILVLC